MTEGYSHRAGTERESATLALSKCMKVMNACPRAGALLGRIPNPGEPLPLERLFSAPDLDRAREAVKRALRHRLPSTGITADIRRATGVGGACDYSIYPLIRNRSVAGLLFIFKSVPPAPASSAGPHPNDRQLIASLPEGVFTIDPEWRITSFNRAAEAMTGFSSEEAIGRLCWEIFRSDLCPKRCPLGIALETAETRLDEELTICDRNGIRKTMLVNVSVLRGNRGKIVGAVETFRPPARKDGEFPAAFPEAVLSGIAGRGEAMREILRNIPEIAACGAHVLISGESGTGKELFARAIHDLSRHRTGPFVAVNCSALAESLLESELFGHEKGAFTGAGILKPGRFETAAGGTIFLDEIGELRPELQVKLLRVLEQRVFERVGGSLPIAMNARVIGATHLHLGRAVAEGRFREDLYFRLRTIPITLPPLRERLEDVPLLAAHFIRKFNARYNKNVHSIDLKIFRNFSGYRWPGNVRELERFIEHAFVFVKGPVIFAHHLPAFEGAEEGRLSSGGAPETEREDRNAVLGALSRAGGRRSEAAALLGISRTSMWRRMKALGITRQEIEAMAKRRTYTGV